MKRAHLLAFPLCAACTTSAVLAQDGQQGFSAGLAVGVSTNPYIGEDNDASPFPLIRYQGNGFSVGTTGVFIDAFSTPVSKLEFVATPRFTGLEDPDADELNGIDRDFTVDAGFRFTYDVTPGTELVTTVLQEVTGEHDGQELRVSLSRSSDGFGFPLKGTVGVSWKSEDLSEYTYGVFASEARGGRDAYSPGSTLTPFVGLSSSIPLSQSAVLIGGVRAEFLEDDISDSPIVDEDVIFGASIGVQFSF
ncbi:MipA/OmpV family protein [Litoreibacter roseus]|uniref:Structural protein MipA n=1 Tax=Litoreibacter roseus TaxID=2601869 RepID=A0A6N6JEU1_9RHOB|nr:MipA/OmpV family protein [Litoreibacter roseus]GFE64746.1 structural protein MipA [Litoreibacter roseus]